MKVFIMCEHCGQAVELKPVDNGQHAYVHSKLTEKNMYISEVTIDAEASGDIEDMDDISDAYITTTLQEVRIDCRNCGRDYIVLTEFGQ